MNWQQISTFIWLRYRLRANQIRRGGTVNSILVALVTVIGVFASIGFFAGGFLIGFFAFHSTQPEVRMLTIDGLTAMFLVAWMIGLMTELQRTDALSIDKFLHLPVSPVGAFLINYVSSLFCLSLILFVPGMVGLILGMACADGPQMLLGLPLLAAFVMAISALTYQFQGWLASLMTNPRRRRTVIVVVTMCFILIFQVPNLLNLTLQPGQKIAEGHKQLQEQKQQRLDDINKELTSGRVKLDEAVREREAAEQAYLAAVKSEDEQETAKTFEIARLVNTVLPPCWLALGTAELSQGRFLPGLFGGMGLALIGSLSLWRAYRTTLRIYSGKDQGGGRTKTASADAKPKPLAPTSDRVTLTEWRLPGVSERVAGVATAALRSYMRAPESKMILIFPFIMILVFGSLFMSGKSLPSPAMRPLAAFGAIAMVLLSGVQLVGNQFGYDRSGFRAYVLSPIPRREILLGKNLAFAPFAVVLVTLALIIIECFCPLRIDHLLNAFVQAIAMFLMFCLLANTLSILTPIPIAAGAIQPKQVKITPVLAQFALLFLFPAAYAPILMPLGIESAVSDITGIKILPIALPLTIVMLIGVLFFYRWCMTLLGQLLVKREKKVLEIVTSKSE